MKIVVTGAAGFLGAEVVARLKGTGAAVIIAVHRKPSNVVDSVNCKSVVVSDLADAKECQSISGAIVGADALVHLAGKTPEKLCKSDDFFSANATTVRNLAKLAAECGVKQFIYISTAQVCGVGATRTPISELTSTDIPPSDIYAASKYQGEIELQSAARGTNLAWTIIRPPLVYGPGAKGSIATLANAVIRGVPLALGRINRNARDMIGVANLVSFIGTCAGNSKALNQVFFVRDGKPISTAELAKAIGRISGRPARLIPAPIWSLRACAALLKKGDMIDRLTGDFRIDDSKARNTLDWTAPQTIDYDLGRMIEKLRSL